MKTFSRIVVSVALVTSTVYVCMASSSIAVGSVPKFVAANQTTNVIYVSNLNSNNVSVIDGTKNTVVATVPVGNSPEMLDTNAITNMVYVANIGDNTVSVIDGTSNTVVATIRGFSGPFGIAVNAITNQIFVSNNSGNTISVIDGSTNAIIATVTVGSSPAGVRLTATANTVYVANVLSGTISVIDSTTDTVKNTFSLPSFAEPVIIALDPITNRLFITDGGNEVVDVLDATSGVLLKTITTGKIPLKQPVYVTVFQPGKTFLISDLSQNAVMEINENSYAATAGIKGGSGTYGLAVNRKTGTVYVAESSNGTVNVYTQLKFTSSQSRTYRAPETTK